VAGRDRAVAAVLLVFGLLALEEARKLRFGTIGRPGPGFFPVVLAAAFSLVCLALLVTAMRARNGAASDLGRLHWTKIVAAMAALIVYAFVLEPAGFVVATFALLLFFFKALERQRWVTAVAGSLVTALITYLVFKVWLHVRLPPGSWSG
jgi:putative tricarboxylic transport membrane protein